MAGIEGNNDGTWDEGDASKKMSQARRRTTTNRLSECIHTRETWTHV